MASQEMESHDIKKLNELIKKLETVHKSDNNKLKDYKRHMTYLRNRSTTELYYPGLLNMEQTTKLREELTKDLSNLGEIIRNLKDIVYNLKKQQPIEHEKLKDLAEKLNVLLKPLKDNAESQGRTSTTATLIEECLKLPTLQTKLDYTQTQNEAPSKKKP